MCRLENALSVPFVLIGLSDSARDHLVCSQSWVRDKCPASPTPVYKNERYRHDRIRIAYVSADFHRHATAYLMAELFERHDRSRFEIIGVSFGVDDRSEIRNRLVAAFDQFHDVRAKSDEEVAKLLHDLQVDIAIDLKGHTQDSRPGILAHRPAPIQASYLGFPGTMGAEFIDYIIADKTVAPFEHQPFYTEKIVHLPDCYQVNDTKRKIAERTPTRREAELPETGFIFCCFNNNWKITPEVFPASGCGSWMRWKAACCGCWATTRVRNGTCARKREHAGLTRPVWCSPVDGRWRTTWRGTVWPTCSSTRCPATPIRRRATHCGRGLPVLTREGTAFAGRAAASLLNAIGLPGACNAQHRGL